MPYFALPNFNHDSGPNRIQSGPDHEGYIVLYSGVESTGPNNGIVVGGAPLSGSPAGGTWDYDSNWRYVPSTLPSQSGSLDPTPYNVSGALDTYNAARIYTRDNVAGAQAASAIGPETGKVNPRGGALQPRANVTRPEKYMYYGGGAPDNQDYSPYNTPDANTAAEGKTGGSVTHRNYESSLLTNLLGSQGTSDRSQWRYHQPVYCKTFTETQRSATPGLMSSPLRYIYRGSATSYNYNYGGELLANRGGFELLPYDDQEFGCPFPVGCPTNSGSPTQIIVGDTLSAVVYCDFTKIEWFNTNGNFIGTGLTYTAAESDIGYKIYYVVTYPDGTTDQSSTSCFDVVVEYSFRFWYTRDNNSNVRDYTYSAVVDDDGDMYVAIWTATTRFPVVYKISNDVTQVWGKAYPLDPSFSTSVLNSFGSSYDLLDTGGDYLDFLAWQWTNGPSPYFLQYPVRIYRFRISKQDGSILEVISTDFNPLYTTVTPPYFFLIENVKIDANNNYYFVGNFPFDSSSSSLCLLKFSETLEFKWCKVSQRIKYRNTGTCVSSEGQGTLNITLDDAQIIGCQWRGSFEYIHSNYFCLDLDGNVLNTFKSKFATPNFSTDTDPFNVRCVCRDSDGFIYALGGYDSSDDIGTFSSVLVYKESSSDQTVWVKDIRPMLQNYGINNISGFDNQLIVVDSKLLLVSTRSYTDVTVRQAVIICVFALDTGDILQCIEIKPPGGGSFGNKAIVQRMPENTKFIVQTARGFRLRFDVNNLPASGFYTTTDNPSFSYSVNDIPPLASGAVFYKFDDCGANSSPTFIDRNLSPYFTPSTPNVTISGATGGFFGYFGGQDIPT